MRRLQSVLVLFVLLSTSFAADKIEKIPQASGIPSPIATAISAEGYRVTGDSKVIAEVWPALTIKGERNGSDSALYPEVPAGAFAGVINFPTGGQDFRGQKIPPGLYSLRYELLPGDGNHLGVAPNPDFVLLVPIATDTNPSTAMPFKAAVKLSSKVPGTNHPAAFSLATAAKSAPSVETDDKGHITITVETKLNDSRILVGIIIAGTAEQ